MPMVYEEDEIAEASQGTSSPSKSRLRRESDDYFSEKSVLRNSILPPSHQSVIASARPSIAASTRSRNASQDSFWALSKTTPQAKRKTSDSIEIQDLKEKSIDKSHLSNTLQSKSDVFEDEVNIIPRNDGSLKSDSSCLLEDVSLITSNCSIVIHFSLSSVTFKAPIL